MCLGPLLWRLFSQAVWQTDFFDQSSKVNNACLNNHQLIFEVLKDLRPVRIRLGSASGRA